jgi:hypothetical protein
VVRYGDGECERAARRQERADFRAPTTWSQADPGSRFHEAAGATAVLRVDDLWWGEREECAKKTDARDDRMSEVTRGHR